MPEQVHGILKYTRSGGVLREIERSLRRNPAEVFVPQRLIHQVNLVEGAFVSGSVRNGRGQRELSYVESVCGLNPAEFRRRVPYNQLAAIDPCERFNLGISGDMSMRVMDLIAPIGKGTRGLVVSPPKAGKTIILENIAKSIRMGDPEARIIVLLIDERPEEVTQFRRSVQAEVLASTSDQTSEEHVELAELVMAHVRTELECGRDIVVLVDSLTRMGRAFNVEGGGSANRSGGRRGGSGRTMSGGMEAGALEIPRRFFGLARNVENGGSVTIIATALVDTGSRMDDLIFEEFKGTGNSELILDRSLAEARIFPAINVLESGTRRDERLYDADTCKRLALLRRALADRTPKDAMETLLNRLSRTKTNEEFLETIPLGK
jgi:transcription termination factor Rho